MSDATSEAVVWRIVEMAKRHGYGRVRIKYGGGEPTLVFPRLLAVHDHLAAEAALAGIALEPILMTNGVAVSAAQLQACADRGIRLAVSLDGGPQGHNAVRCLPGGHGTYEAVVRTITRALDGGMSVSVSITLAAQTLLDAEIAVAFAMDHDLPFNLNFVRVDAGGTGIVPRVDALTQALRRCLHAVESRLDAYAHPLTGILDRVHFDVPHAHTCAAGRDYLAIDTQGRTAPCQMLLDHPWGSMTEAAPLDALRLDGQSRFGAPVDDRPDCASCLWRYACAGGCPLLRKTPVHDRYCRVYRTMLPEVMALEGRRLLTRWMAA
jgi:uncharacterized protein